MPKLYAVAGFASKVVMEGALFRNIISRIRVRCIEANSDAEAEGKGLEFMRSEAPMSEEWFDHNALVLQIPRNLIDKYATPKPDKPEPDKSEMVWAVIPDEQRGVTNVPKVIG